MILSHFSVKDFVFDPKRVYLQNHFKPRGLWLSDESEWGWKSWCEQEEFGLERLESETHFSIKSDANIFRLSNLTDVRLFEADDQWQDERYANSPYGTRQIDWGKLAAQYDGILITPYIRDWMATDIPIWYYGWDVPSGCVWNLNAIEPVDSRLKEEVTKALEELREPDKWWDKQYDDLHARVSAHQKNTINSSIDF